jgi:hypothetical protein
MFLMSPGVVEAMDAAGAIRLLGWGECAVGPVEFGGVRFWAGVYIDRAEHAHRMRLRIGPVLERDRLAEHLESPRGSRMIEPAVRLLGCLVGDDDAAVAMRAASLLAGYAPRAVLVHDKKDLTDLAIDAALLDQGIVVIQNGHLQLLTEAGPRVTGLGFDAREWELLETVYAAWLVGTNPCCSGPAIAQWFMSTR